MMTRILQILLLLPVLVSGPVKAQSIAYEEAPHHYWSAPLTDAGSVLDAELQNGTFKLPRGSDLEAMRAVLARLRIPESSQTLVFSRTSVQKDHISPWNPRAIYFNDEGYAAWVPGGLMEFALIDPVLGPIFYLLDFDRPDRAFPRLDRPQSCLDCHGSNMTNRLPGVMIRSVFPDREGSVLFQAGTTLIDHTTPVEKRWGGWFVTGKHGTMEHRGNAFAEAFDGHIRLDTSKSANRSGLPEFFAAAKYPRGTSDIVALMVLEHQVMMTSRLVEASYEVRAALVRQKVLREELGEPPVTEPTSTAQIITRNHVEKILEVLLFRNEAELPEGGIQGDPEFQRDFCKGRAATASGESLASFHLGNRLFMNRCSYLIHSRLWAALPPPLLELLYARLFEILSPEKAPSGYGYLSREERQRILTILRECQPGLPAYWKE